MSFSISILLGRKIHPHDIAFSSFSGGIAHVATSNLNPDPFPVILCVLITGLIVTVLSHKLKKPLNNPDVFDTRGTLFTFLFLAIIGEIYAGILAAFRPHPSEVPNSVNTSLSAPNHWIPSDRTKISQGGLQIAAIYWTIGIVILASLTVGLIYYLSSNLSANEVLNDTTFAEVADEDHDVKGTPQYLAHR